MGHHHVKSSCRSEQRYTTAVNWILFTAPCNNWHANPDWVTIICVRSPRNWLSKMSLNSGQMLQPVRKWCFASFCQQQHSIAPACQHKILLQNCTSAQNSRTILSKLFAASKYSWPQYCAVSILWTKISQNPEIYLPQLGVDLFENLLPWAGRQLFSLLPPLCAIWIRMAT